MSAKYYVRFSRLPFEEDMTHEFKGHRNFCMEEIPPWALMKDEFGRPSRKPISRNLCGFLNTGKGGTVYCGVVNDGVVHGLALTQFQREHITGGLQDLMNRFTPPVPSSRYKIRFVPVFGSSVPEEQRQEMLTFKAKEHADPELRKLKHIYRDSNYCWCDQENLARYKNGTLTSEYVIEVTVRPWDPEKEDNEGIGHFLNIHPIYACDKGGIYFRQSASLQKYTLQEITRMTFYEVDKRKTEKISKLKKHIAELELPKKESVSDRSKRRSSSEKSLPSEKSSSSSEKSLPSEKSSSSSEKSLPSEKSSSSSEKLPLSPPSYCHWKKSDLSTRLKSSALHSLPSGNGNKKTTGALRFTADGRLKRNSLFNAEQ